MDKNGVLLRLINNQPSTIEEMEEHCRINKTQCEIYYATVKARRRGFSGAATLTCGAPTGGAPDDFSRRGFGPTGHVYRAEEGRRTEEFIV